MTITKRTDTPNEVVWAISDDTSLTYYREDKTYHLARHLCGDNDCFGSYTDCDEIVLTPSEMASLRNTHLYEDTHLHNKRFDCGDGYSERQKD